MDSEDGGDPEVITLIETAIAALERRHPLLAAA